MEKLNFWCILCVIALGMAVGGLVAGLSSVTNTALVFAWVAMVGMDIDRLDKKVDVLIGSYLKFLDVCIELGKDGDAE